MKITDDYKAKYRLWAANPQIVPAAAAARIPNFTSRRFFLARGDERLEKFGASAAGAGCGCEMNELIQQLNAAGIRYFS